MEIHIILSSMIIGQVWIILIQPDYLLDFMGSVIDRTMKWPKVHHLLTCSTCIAGQISLWWYLIWAISFVQYSLTTHFFIVAITIWLTSIVNKTFFE